VLLAGLSCTVALVCVVASARRLAQAVTLTSLDSGAVVDALKGPEGPVVAAALRDELEASGRFVWERDLLTAFAAEERAVRDALVNEQLTELDGQAQRWARTPRVCASIATSTGFLLASMAIVQGLSASATDDTPDTPIESRAAVVGALDALAAGIAGASFCYAVHVRARRIVRERLAAVDRMIVLMEAHRVTSETNEGTSHRPGCPARG